MTLEGREGRAWSKKECLEPSVARSCDFGDGVMLGYSAAVPKLGGRRAASRAATACERAHARSVLGSWVGARRLFDLSFIPDRVPHGF